MLAKNKLAWSGGHSAIISQKYADILRDTAHSANFEIGVVQTCVNQLNLVIFSNAAKRKYT